MDILNNLVFEYSKAFNATINVVLNIQPDESFESFEELKY